MLKDHLPRAFGLDFGTTNSALGVAEPGGRVTLAHFNGTPTFRSIIYFEDDDPASRKIRVLAGPDAIKSYLNARTPGRLIQSSNPISPAGSLRKRKSWEDAYSLEQLIGVLLRQLRNAAEAQLGDLGSPAPASMQRRSKRHQRSLHDGRSLVRGGHSETI
jgi:hypothetical chaperone protein